MAYKWGCPVVPLAISYRERKGLYRLFGPKEMPTVTIRVGEPLMPDTTKPRKEETERLRAEAHAAMVRLAGIKHNPWEAVPDDELKIEN
jgi:1-acyl-sn-glycerol-3-phosphate acyltransferase